MRASSPATAPISTTCASTVSPTPSSCARRTPMPGSARSTRPPPAPAPGVLAVLTAAEAAADGLQPLRPYAEANVQTGEPFTFAPQPLLADRQGALSPASRWRWSWPRRRPRRSTRPSWSRSTTSRCPPSRRPPPPARQARRSCRRRGAGQCLHRLADRRCRGRRQPPSPAPRTSSRSTSTITASSPTRWSRAAASAVRSGERPLHAARLQPEHPHQPQPRRPRARRRAHGRALHRARCRRRLRRQELRLRRARADPVGGQAHRPAGEMDRQPQRGVPVRPCRARHAGRGVAGARCSGQVSGAEGRERRQCRRLHGRRRRRRADLPVRPPAGHGLSHPRDRAAYRGGAHQHHADRRHARAGLRRDGEHPGTADRRGGAAGRLRPRRAAPAQHGAGRAPCR